MGPLRPSTRFDLHLHTDRSDGRFDAAEVLLRCARGGLDVVAITDHDLPPDLRPGVHVLQGRELTLLAGAEVSGMHDGREHHLLVYFPGEIPQGFAAFCRDQCVERATRYAEAVERLAVPGLAAPDDGARRGDHALTRLHLAQQLVANGHARGVQDAFARYLSESHGKVPPLSLAFVDAIRLARAFGGLTSWAHPPLPAVERYVAELAAAGLQGLEVLRPGVSADERKRLRKIAQRHGLYLTGGSDWHGWTEQAQPGLFRVEAREIDGFVDALRAA